MITRATQDDCTCETVILLPVASITTSSVETNSLPRRSGRLGSYRQHPYRPYKDRRQRHLAGHPHQGLTAI